MRDSLQNRKKYLAKVEKSNIFILYSKGKKKTYEENRNEEENYSKQLVYMTPYERLCK